MSSYEKDLDELVDDAERQGWRTERLSSGHVKFLAPDGKGTAMFAGTPSDHRAWLNSLAELKRHGYRPPDDRAELLAKRGSRGIVGAIRDYLRSIAPAVASIEEVTVVVSSKVPNVNQKTVGQTLTNLYKQGDLVRAGHGMYRWAESLPVAPVASASPPPPPSPDIELVVIDDERELDEALAALGRIEAVVRKYKAIARQLAELKKALGVAP